MKPATNDSDSSGSFRIFDIPPLLQLMRLVAKRLVRKYEHSATDPVDDAGRPTEQGYGLRVPDLAGSEEERNP